VTQIAFLADNAQVIPRLADWYRGEWGPYYGVHGPGHALFDLKSRCNHDRVPIGLVAMKGQQVQGTVALGLDEATSLEPLVIGLLVGPEYRRQGVGMLLIESAESLAKQLGFDRIFLSTMVLDNLLRRLGWQPYGEVEFQTKEVGSIFVCDLDRHRP